MIVIFSKLISAFLLPPGVFVLLFGWLAWLLRPKTLHTHSNMGKPAGKGLQETFGEPSEGSFNGSNFSGWGERRKEADCSNVSQPLSSQPLPEQIKPSEKAGFWRNRKLPFVLACAGAGFLYLLSTEVGSDFLLQPLEDRYPPLPARGMEGFLQEKALIESARVAGVVILGGGTVAGSPEKGMDDVREESLKRLLYGVRIYRELSTLRNDKTFLILSGGRVFDVGQEAEATLMGRYASEWGVNPGSILLDPDSRTTWENARNVASRFPLKQVILVTSAYHMPRAVWCFSQQKVEVIPAPTDYKVNRGIPYDVESFLPTLNWFQHSRRALHEYLGSFLYWMAYR